MKRSESSFKQRLSEEAAMLGRVRLAVAREELDSASRMLELLVESADLWVALQAKIQLGLVLSASDRVDEADAALGEVRAALEVKRRAQREGEVGAAPSRAAEKATLPVFGLMLELGRTWTRIERPERARSIYAELLRDRYGRKPGSEEMTHMVALAECRLAELRVEDDLPEAYRRWRRVLALRDERVTPYAALQIAVRIGSLYLVSERVTLLFRQAMGSGDPWLFSEATLGLARHLKSQHRFEQARDRYRQVLECGVPGALVEEAAAELDSMGQVERMVSHQQMVRRPQRLLAKVRGASLRPGRREDGVKRALIVGAGSGGVQLLESLDQSRYRVCGFVDDFAAEAPGHRVLGRIDDLEAVIRECEPDEVLLAIPTLPGARRRDVVRACEATTTSLLHLPAIHDLGIGWTREESRSRLRAQLRPVKVAELIGTKPVLIDPVATAWLQDHPVVVVGAGGLGAEVCRRLADGGVGRLLVVDRNESALRKVGRELWNTRRFWAFESRVGNAADPEFLFRVFRECSPTAVFNTAGDFSTQALSRDDLVWDPERWKSVIENEVAVAEATAQAALRAAVPSMVHASSVRARGCPEDDPFGAMKALAEQVVLRQARRRPWAPTARMVVRIGSLLDSRHGRLTGMEEQIRAGAPVEIPKQDARLSYNSTACWAERMLRATALAGNGDLVELDGGTEITARKIMECALSLAGIDPDDADTEETPDEWGDPPSTEKRTALGEAALQMHLVESPQATDRALESAVETCARALEEQVGAENGPLIRDQLAGLVGLSEPVGACY